MSWIHLGDSGITNVALLTGETPTGNGPVPIDINGSITLQREAYAEVPPKQNILVQCEVWVQGTPGASGQFIAILFDAEMSPTYITEAGINGIDFTATIPASGEFTKVIQIAFQMPEVGQKQLRVGFWGPDNIFYVHSALFTIVAMEGAPPPANGNGDVDVSSVLFPDLCTEYAICIPKKYGMYAVLGVGGIIGLKLVLSTLVGGRRR